jgi:anti-sigma B factor antagonist
LTTGPRYRIELDEAGEVPVLVVKGDIDMASAPKLADAVASQPGQVLIADLSGVEFIDSTGLRALIAADELLASREGRLLIVTTEGPVQRIIDLTGLDGRFDIFESVEAAAGGASS